MTMPKKILVCSELGRASDNALRRAALICSATSASVALLHVIDDPSEDLIGEFSPVDPAWLEHIRQAARAALEKQVKRHWPADLPTPTIVVQEGATSPMITTYVNEHQIDLVIVGTRGGGAWKKYFIGTTATRVVRKLKVPVLVVKRPADAPYKRVLLPVDFSDYTLRTLEHAQGVMPGARITLMHAYEAPFEGKMAYAGIDKDGVMHYLRKTKEDVGHRLRALAWEAGLTQGKFSMMLRHGHAYREVREAERSGAFDCVAIGKHGRGFLNELLLGSTTEHMLLESGADVLVVPLPE